MSDMATTAPAADTIKKQVEISAPMARVWRALTDSGEFGTWFGVTLDGPFVAGQPVGGNLTFEGYEHVRMDIVVKDLDPQTYFSYTWHPYALDPNVDYSVETPTLVEFRLKSTEVGTLLTVTESGFDKLPPHRIAEALAMDTQGWEAQMRDIKAYVDQHP